MQNYPQSGKPGYYFTKLLREYRRRSQSPGGTMLELLTRGEAHVIEIMNGHYGRRHELEAHLREFDRAAVVRLDELQGRRARISVTTPSRRDIEYQQFLQFFELSPVDPEFEEPELVTTGWPA